MAEETTAEREWNPHSDGYIHPHGPSASPGELAEAGCPKIRTVRDLLGPSFPRIVCLCGSTRFRAFFAAANLKETLEGRIILSIGCTHADDKALGLTHDAKQRLDELHLRKIDLADEVLVLNVGGYIGASTGNELAYALALGKPVRTLEPLDLEEWRAERTKTMTNSERGTRNLEP